MPLNDLARETIPHLRRNLYFRGGFSLTTLLSIMRAKLEKFATLKEMQFSFKKG